MNTLCNECEAKAVYVVIYSRNWNGSQTLRSIVQAQEGGGGEIIMLSSPSPTQYLLHRRWILVCPGGVTHPPHPHLFSVSSGRRRFTLTSWTPIPWAIVKSHKTLETRDAEREDLVLCSHSECIKNDKTCYVACKYTVLVKTEEKDCILYD